VLSKTSTTLHNHNYAHTNHKIQFVQALKSTDLNTGSTEQNAVLQFTPMQQLLSQWSQHCLSTLYTHTSSQHTTPHCSQQWAMS